MPGAIKSKKDDTIVSNNNNKSKTKKLFHKLLHPRSSHKDKNGPPPDIVTTNTTTTQQLQHPLSTTRSSLQPQQLFDNDTPNKKNNNNKKKSTTIKLKTSWLSRTKWFTKMSNAAFAIVDADESGEVDEKELYSGLLLIHLKLGCYAGPAACRPVDRERVHAVFEKMDVDDSKSLNQEEFKQVMMVLCSNIFTRVLVQCKCNIYVYMCVYIYM